MRWARGEVEPFRRTDFREKAPPNLGSTIPAAPVVAETRKLIVANQDLYDLLDGLGCSIVVVGSDLHISCVSRADTDKLLARFKLRGIHGVIRNKVMLALAEEGADTSVSGRIHPLRGGSAYSRARNRPFRATRPHGT